MRRLEDRLMEIALEAGAEDVRTVGEAFEVICAPEAFQPVTETLEAAKIPTDSAELTRIPINTVDLDGDSARSVLKLIEALLASMDQVTPQEDAKLQHLKAHVLGKIGQPINPGNRKVLIFTAFADTADYLYANLAFDGGEGPLFDLVSRAFDPARVTHPVYDEELWRGTTDRNDWLDPDDVPVGAASCPEEDRERCFKMQADYGYCAAKDMHYYGFKLGLRVARSGMITSFPLLPARPHDINLLDDLVDGFAGLVPADKG